MKKAGHRSREPSFGEVLELNNRQRGILYIEVYVGSCYQKIDGGVCQVCKLFVLSRLSPFELITEEAVENL